MIYGAQCEHNRQQSRALLQSIVGTFKSIITTSLPICQDSFCSYPIIPEIIPTHCVHTYPSCDVHDWPSVTQMCLMYVFMVTQSMCWHPEQVDVKSGTWFRLFGSLFYIFRSQFPGYIQHVFIIISQANSQHDIHSSRYYSSHHNIIDHSIREYWLSWNSFKMSCILKNKINGNLGYTGSSSRSLI